MDDAEPWTDRQCAAMRAILLGWGNLSRGDISIVTCCIREPAALALTVRGSAHASFWQELVALGWAEQLYSPIDPYEHDPEPLTFRLVIGSERALAHFLVFYDLLNMGACTPACDKTAALARGGENDDPQQDNPSAVFAPQKNLKLLDLRFVIKCWLLIAILLVGATMGRVASG